MVATLKITKTLLGCILTVTLFYFSVTTASQPITEIEQLLSAPSFIDHFKNKSPDSKQLAPRQNPLVAQAELWVKEPPAPVRPAKRITKEAPKPKPEARPAITQPKFTLIATSLSRDDTSNSLALINELGGQQRWIRIGDKVGHLEISDILNGKVLYNDGERSVELAIAEPQTPQLKPMVSPTKAPRQSEPFASRPTGRLAANEPKLQNLDITRTYSRPLPRSLRER